MILTRMGALDQSGLRKGPWMRFGSFLVMLLWLGVPARAEDAREFTLSVSAEIDASGLMPYLLPRFALKTNRKARLVPAPADIALITGGQGQTVMARAGEIYGLIQQGDNPAASIFADWLLSPAGQNTIAAFIPADGEGFTGAAGQAVQAAIIFEGDPIEGARVAAAHCGRCHRTDPESRNIGIGSTPTFAVLRGLPGWEERILSFYALNPHPSFLRVDGISPPFDPAHPPPIVPVEISQDEAEAIAAYVASLAPADLGAGLVNRQ